MQNTKIKRILAIMLCFLMIIAVSAPVFAINGMWENLGHEDSNVDTNGVVNIGKSVITILRAVGIILSIIVLMILGIKYMMGSAEEKSEYKKSFMPYLIGAVVLFAASAFAQTLVEWISGIKFS